ncbi:MAG: membrane-bound lytic murein transglycosylase MltF [Gammaproteobacteria bacterium]|nr:membrane-bound lytic murein transglycosylase MltF [Gammaproteobacteria bacterium]MBT8151362.1 membrane-bound lytic murein transglycosylase MltF [Gammaproteobacteria bacterium]NND39247.1 membrane-bound lytic murein transglycosylase MltF [Pseudomonadales bacterium]NNM12009.1 membrane-bound lytic murein transglycosylase MltF [Pseudomonadales bacterium]
MSGKDQHNEQEQAGAKSARKPLPRFTAALAGIAMLCVIGIGYQLATLQRIDAQIPEFAKPSANDTLDVITRVSPNTYFESDRGPNGFEFALLQQFATAQGKTLKVHTADSLAGVFEALASGQADIASAGLTPTRERRHKFLFSRPYLESRPIVVYKVGQSKPRRHSDLVGKKLVVVAQSSHANSLLDIKKTLPALAWREVDSVDFTQLLAMVEQGAVDYTVIDSAEFMLHQGSFPSLKRGYDLGAAQTFNWMFAKNLNGARLQSKANGFLTSAKSNGSLAHLEERYFSQSSELGQVAANEFAKNVRSRLPRYLDNIKLVAQEHDLDWRLLAAISYQESSWNPRAISPTGVRGMMMLTLPTAKELGIKNRLDTMQSLRGGATYYKRLKARLPERIGDPDRSWFALAAYNVGMGHLEDARRLTQHRGMNPDSWLHVKENLPLLTQPEWYKRTRYGYARGHEPVTYVQRIRHFYNVLVWRDLSDKSNIIAMRDNWRELIGDDWADTPRPVAAISKVRARAPVRTPSASGPSSAAKKPTSTLASAADIMTLDGITEPTNSL